MACEDCLEVCFLRLVVERFCVWCLVTAAIFMGFGQAGAKMCGRCLKSSIGGDDASHKRGALFIGKAGSHCVILLYCEILLQVLLGIYCKRYYWIPLFTVALRV